MKNFDFLLDAPTTRDLSTDELLLLPSEEDLDSKELRFFTPQIADKYFKMDENTGRMLLSQSALSQSSHDPLLKAALSSSGISAETDMAPSSIVSAPKKKLETLGSQWFDMPALDVTPELKREVELIQMRDVLDPKRFYKRAEKIADLKKPQIFLQRGTIIEPSSEFFSSHLSKRQRGSGYLEELLLDVDNRSYYKKKFTEVQSARKELLSKQRNYRAPSKKHKRNST